MNKIILYHGSPQIVERPKLSKCRPNNDFGTGFYCTEHMELAREWAVTEGRDGYVNTYELDLNRLRTINILSSDYHILHWLALLINYRRVRLSTPLMRRGAEWLKENYLVDLQDADIVRGYRADDSYFSFARAFVNNEISLRQLQFVMHLGKLGEQVVLRSPEAFSAIRYITCERVDHTVWYIRRRQRDLQARKSYLEELEKEDADGLYIRDLINGAKPLSRS